MNCDQFERLIALQVEGDLPDNRKSKLSKHLSICGSCHRFAEELRDSQSALRGYTGEDFDESLLAGMRQSVMAQINRGEVEFTYWEHLARWFGIGDFHRFAWTISGAMAVLALAASFAVVALVRTGRNVELGITVPTFSLPGAASFNTVAGAPAQRPSRVNNHRRQEPAHNEMLPFASEQIATNMQSVESVTGSEFSENSSTLDSSTTPVAPVAKNDVTRIEIQTANPKIKIIWFIDKKPIAPPATVLSSDE